MCGPLDVLGGLTAIAAVAVRAATSRSVDATPGCDPSAPDGPSLAVVRVERHRRYHRRKRLLDLTAALLLALLSLPVFILIAILIRLESRGSPLYSRLRCGKSGRPFKCYKFRSMYADADARLTAILSADPLLSVEYGHYHKLRRDPRITRVGRILRRLSLDELPQLWNVIVGDMSLIGPRPYDVAELPSMGSRAAIILTVRPGLTGLWQVSGRNTTSFVNRLALDAAYARTSSPWLDVKILARTLPTVISGEGAS